VPTPASLLLGGPAPVEARLAAVDGAAAAVLMVGGVGGGFDSPARGLYARLSHGLPARGVAALRVRFRQPGDLESCTDDVALGVAELTRRGCARVALLGHSFGGAVVIRAALRQERVVAVCTLSAQSHGTADVADLAPRPLLAVHGTRDPVLPPACSVDIVRRAGSSARLRLVEGAAHTFDPEADEVHDLVRGWLLDQLAPGDRAG
jgi:alpha/beta superfamily hydrolase